MALLNDYMTKRATILAGFLRTVSILFKILRPLLVNRRHLSGGKVSFGTEKKAVRWCFKSSISTNQMGHDCFFHKICLLAYRVVSLCPQALFCTTILWGFAQVLMMPQSNNKSHLDRHKCPKRRNISWLCMTLWQMSHKKITFFFKEYVAEHIPAEQC